MSNIAVPAQDAIEVFVNSSGSISIARNDPYESEPIVIAVQPIFVDALVKALRAAKRKAKGSEK